MIFHLFKFNRLRLIVCFVSCLLFSTKTHAQKIEAGFNLGYQFSRLKVTENNISRSKFVRQGQPFNGVSFGIQAIVSPPEKQSTSKFKIKSSAMFEGSLCRCGGNIELSTTLPTGQRTFSPLKYLFYRGDYSLKYVASMGSLQFLIGPTLTNLFYVGVDDKSDSFGYADAESQFNNYKIGYEFGLAAKINTVQLSLRYHKIIGDFGRETDVIPTAYKNFQIRLMVHYYFLRKENGLNWGSIYWD